MSVEKWSGTGARKALIEAVLEASASDHWAEAQLEWDTIRHGYDPDGAGKCHCGQENLVKLFTIRNRLNGEELHPIGSTCIREHFESPVMQAQLRVHSDVLDLEAAIIRGEPLSLKKHLSRSAIKSLRALGVIDEGQREDLTDLFNRRAIRIAPSEWRAVDTLLRTVVTPALGGEVPPPSPEIEAMVEAHGLERVKRWATDGGPGALGLDEYGLEALQMRGVLSRREWDFLQDMVHAEARTWSVSPRQRAWRDSLLGRIRQYARAALGGAA